MGKYTEAHNHSQGPGDARPTAIQIVKDEGLVGKLDDKVVLITGTSSGIGIETVRAMSQTGAKVFCAVRNLKKAEEALSGILEPGRVELLEMDNGSLDSIRAAAKAFLAKSDKLNILINNAGVMATPEGKTADGFETQLGTNHFAHFLLFQLLKPTLLKSATPEFSSRVVNVSSTGHRGVGIQFENLNFEKSGSYTPWGAYSQSKTANIYMANEIERRYASQNLHGYSLHPGGIDTGLQIHVPQQMKDHWSQDETIQKMFKSREQGAATTVFCALSKEWEGKGGRYFEECEESQPVKQGFTVTDPGYVAHTYNPEAEKKLWVESLKLLGLDDD